MPNGCLEWTGWTNDAGYGQIMVNGKQTGTHRLAWEVANGPIPAGFCVCHHCDNPPCCDAERCLFLGTKADNAADMAAKGRAPGQQKTHCPDNHPYDAANTYIDSRGYRVCRKCRRATIARYQQKQSRSIT